MAVLFLRLQVIWPIGFHQDNALAANWLAGAHRDGMTLFGYCHLLSEKLLSTQGRFIPVTMYLLAPLQIVLGEDLTALRGLQAVWQLAAFIAFALFIKRLSRDEWLAGTIIVVFASIYEIREYPDPATGVGLLLPTLVLFGSLSCFFSLRSAENPNPSWDFDWWLAVIFSLFNILTWELALPFCFLVCVFLLFGPTPRHFRWLRATAAGLPPLILTVLSLWLKRKSTYSGTTLGSMDPSILWSTFSGQAVSALPLSYQYFDPQHLFQPGWSAHADYFTALGIGLLTTGAVGIGVGQCRPKRLSMVIFCGVVLVIAPALMIAVSARYQVDTAPGLGYTETCLTYGGVSVLAMAGLSWSLNAVGVWKKNISYSLALLAAIGFGLIAGQTLIGSAWIADVINQKWRNPREMLAVWLHAVENSSGSPSLIVVEQPSLYRWENSNFLFEHLRTRSNFVTRRDFDASGRQAPVGITLIDLSFTPQVQRSGRFIVIAVTSQGVVAHRTIHLTAFVISANRYSLEAAPFRLEKGNQSWAVPDLISMGYGGYFYRELEIETDSPWVEGCRFITD